MFDSEVYADCVRLAMAQMRDLGCQELWSEVLPCLNGMRVITGSWPITDRDWLREQQQLIFCSSTSIAFGTIALLEQVAR